MTWYMWIPLYLVGTGAAFVLLGNKYYPKDYWEGPGPFFGSLVWPIFIPMLIGGGFARRLIGVSSGMSKDEKRREREIEEAEHRRNLARIEAETTAELERALQNV